MSAPRVPLAQVQFDALPMRTHVIAARRWVNLRFAAHAFNDKLYFPNPASRLTPVTMTVPCLYLAQFEETAFKEIYGDRLYAAKEAGVVLAITDKELEERVFIQVGTRQLVLCDLVEKGAADDIGFDAGTLYASNPTHPQSFAERIFHHPLKVDGIRYLSRHTQERCCVVWERTRDSGLADLVAGSVSPLQAHATATRLDSLELFGATIRIVDSV